MLVLQSKIRIIHINNVYLQWGGKINNSLRKSKKIKNKRLMWPIYSSSIIS